MSTTIRPKLSAKNPYAIDKDHYYELKHFCRQYDLWKKRLAYIDLGNVPAAWIGQEVHSNNVQNPTEKLAILRARYSEKISLVDNALSRLEPLYRSYIKETVVNNRSYNYLHEVEKMPFCKNTFYEQYHKFFWYLSMLR